MRLRGKIFLGLLFGFLVWNLDKFHTTNTEGILQQPFRYKVGTRCGIIEDNFATDRKVKHGYSTDLYLKIRYDTGTEIVKVNPETWYDTSVGERICFDVYESMLFTGLVALITYLVLIVFLVGEAVVFIIWIFEPKNKRL